MKRKTASRNEMKLQELTAKALRRSDKLANTLRKLTAKSDPKDTSIERLLKEVEKALPRLRRLADPLEGVQARQDQGRVDRTSGKARQELSVPPKSRSRKTERQPGSAPAVAE